MPRPGDQELDERPKRRRAATAVSRDGKRDGVALDKAGYRRGIAFPRRTNRPRVNELLRRQSRRLPHARLAVAWRDQAIGARSVLNQDLLMLARVDFAPTGLGGR